MTKMKLSEAFRIIQDLASGSEEPQTVHLACGFTPLHLATFLEAFLGQRGNRSVSISLGDSGDLCTNLERLAQTNVGEVIVVIEWPDLDPRLGYRGSHGWRPQLLPDILKTAVASIKRIERAVRVIGQTASVSLACPTLPLPPLFPNSIELEDPIALELLQEVCRFSCDMSVEGVAKVLSRQYLDDRSPFGDRYDLASDIRSGFPYHLSHASQLASAFSNLLRPEARKKGIITDLDNTLWHGILGEDGIDGIFWHLDDNHHRHALYQEMLASLSELGILIGVASKNDPELVQEALKRDDLIISPDILFPVEASWGAKSDAVSRILEKWNISENDVVFIDDSAMERAEVSGRFPAISCLAFPEGSDDEMLGFLESLRSLFGKAQVTEEDGLRIQSVRENVQFSKKTIADNADDFLSEVQAKIVTRFNSSDQRSFELVNKSNQFNLNGRRISETEWKKRIDDPNGFIISLSYKDKFGPLGQIAVVSGLILDEQSLVDIWVMSCRAFSRRIEYQTLCELFNLTKSDVLSLDFSATDRNRPMANFLLDVSGENPIEKLNLKWAEVKSRFPALFMKVTHE